MSATASRGCGCETASCGCCEGVQSLTPESTANRPGLSTLSYRVGMHGSFLQTMQARLASHEIPGGLAYDGSLAPPLRPLAALATRDSSDASMAMLDAWATVADVLTFYQERIANEGYLRTATQMRSVFELARLVGYQPRPGVAASVYLAYTVDNNTKEEVVIPRGARSQSVPGPGELPQSFETSEDLRARAAWNELKVRQTQPQRLATIKARRRLLLKGVTTGLNPGDPLLAIEKNQVPALFRVMEVLPENEHDRTRITLQPWLQDAIDARLAPLIALLEIAPKGRIAEDIVADVRDVIDHASEAQSNDLLPRDRVTALIATIDARLGALELAARKLRAWAARVRTALAATIDVQPAAPVNDPTANLSASSLVNRLTRSGSRPRNNALQLPRSLTTNFGATSDAGLQVLSTLAPALRSTIGPALAGQTDAHAAQSLEIYAFRVRAGVFGRNAPKQQRIVPDFQEPPGSRTETIGEWPIVEMTPERIGIDGSSKLAKITRINESEHTIHLDLHYDGIVPDSWVLVDASAVETPKNTWVHRSDSLVLAHARAVHGKISRAVYGISGDTIRLELDQPWLGFDTRVRSTEPMPLREQPDIDNDFRVIRNTTVFARSEKLALALEPIEDDVCGGADEDEPVELDGLYQDLEPGRFAIVSGERADLGEQAVVRASEVLMIRAVTHDVRAADSPLPWTASTNRDTVEKLPADTIHTFVWFDKPLSYCYRRTRVSIRANIVKATHGETRNETLGNGDGSKTLQTFSPKQFPITYLAAPTPNGAASTLEVFVNDVRWHERESFVMTGATDHIYVTKVDEDGKATVIFGNGREGARLPTGMENVKALYRYGIGKPGNVRAEQISQLSTRPLGVKEVINPLHASGGADRESRDQARRNAPNAVMALDRLVSTRDYADFARSSAGIGKAASVELTDGSRTVVHVTIAGSDDIPIDPSSDLFVNLRRALRALGDPLQPIELELRELLILVISVRIRIDPDYLWEKVATEVRTRLMTAFGFEQRDLGQDVTSSEVLSVIQSVRGVMYVDLESFGELRSMVPDAEAEGQHRAPTPEEIADGVAKVVAKSSPASRVIANMARLAVDGQSILPAQLAVLIDAPATLVLNQIK